MRDKLDIKDLSENEIKTLTDSKVFCIAPWIHLHVWPEGKVSPCCWSTSSSNPILDKLSENKSLKDIWNGQEIKTLRKRMLNNLATEKYCSRCYDIEKVGAHSLRQKLNSDFKHHFHITKDTLSDGSLQKFHMPYVDIRFSNLCNFKCRTCGPQLSSAWAAEKGDKKVKEVSQIYPGLMTEILSQIESFEEIYFAGGEPLLMKEHLILLEELIKRNLTHVRLKYNTNFSISDAQFDRILFLWKKFPEVYVGASLDASLARAELIRKGTHWPQILKNRNKLRIQCPHVIFNIETTVSALNVWHLTDFVRESITSGFILPDGFFANLLQSPSYLSTQILPKKLKNEISTKLVEFIRWHEATYPHHNATTVPSIKSVLSFMNKKNKLFLWPRFLFEMKRTDAVRNENTFEVLSELKSYSYF